MTSDHGGRLVLVAHGTRSVAGRRTIGALAADIRCRVAVPTRLGFVDGQPPRVGRLLGAPSPPAVVVPLLLSVGYHVRVDIGGALRPGSVAADPLGPDPRLAAILVQRLAEAGYHRDDAVVLAAAGSSDPQAAIAVEQMRHLLAQNSIRADVGYLATAAPTLAQAVAAARRPRRRVVVASYLLAPGSFHRVLAESGADLVTAPLAPHPQLVEIALDRYRAALALQG